MRFLVDQNLPTVLCDWLDRSGHAASHIRLIGMKNAADTDIVFHARKIDAVLVTRDKDFIPVAGGDNIANWLQVVIVRLGNITNPDLIAAWEQAWPAMIDALKRGEPLVTIGR